jgi:hypothetical protein
MSICQIRVLALFLYKKKAMGRRSEYGYIWKYVNQLTIVAGWENRQLKYY